MFRKNTWIWLQSPVNCKMTYWLFLKEHCREVTFVRSLFLTDTKNDFNEQSRNTRRKSEANKNWLTLYESSSEKLGKQRREILHSVALTRVQLFRPVSHVHWHARVNLMNGELSECCDLWHHPQEFLIPIGLVFVRSFEIVSILACQFSTLSTFMILSRINFS